jgi:cytochrome c-type biogenesis protein CcmE
VAKDTSSFDHQAKKSMKINTIRRRRLYFLSLFFVAIAIASFLVMRALEKNINLYYTPTELAKQSISNNTRIRVGGIVQKGSVIRPEGLDVFFIITDLDNHIQVKYSGILPDLFKEGQGVIAGGYLQEGALQADEVLAKHDENYQPPKVLRHVS